MLYNLAPARGSNPGSSDLNSVEKTVLFFFLLLPHTQHSSKQSFTTDNTQMTMMIIITVAVYHTRVSPCTLHGWKGVPWLGLTRVLPARWPQRRWEGGPLTACFARQVATETVRLMDEKALDQQTDEQGDLFMWLKHQAQQGVTSAQVAPLGQGDMFM